MLPRIPQACVAATVGMGSLSAMADDLPALLKEHGKASAGIREATSDVERKAAMDAWIGKLIEEAKKVPSREHAAPPEAQLRNAVIPSESICPGSQPCLSPDGRKLAFVRWQEMRPVYYRRGKPVLESRLWVRTIEDGSERELSARGNPIGWMGNDILLLSTGVGVDPGTAETTKAIPVLPADFQFRNVRWSRDGQWLCYLPDTSFYQLNKKEKPDLGTDRSLHLMRRGGKPLPVASDASVNHDAPGTLAFSPDGKSLAFHALFFRKGNVPHRRIGFVDVATQQARYVADGVYVHGNPGLRRAESLSCQRRCRWDEGGRHFVFVNGKGDGDADVYLASPGGEKPIRITGDGLPKWSPVLDPAGRRAAFFVAESIDATGPTGVRILVLDLLNGDIRLVETPDEGVGLTLQWSADGRALVYGWNDGEVDARIYRCGLPAPLPMPDNAPLLSVHRPIQSEIVRALESGREAFVYWGIEKAREHPTPETVAAVCRALKDWTEGERSRPAVNLLRLLRRLEARSAAASVEAVLELEKTNEDAKRTAMCVLLEWHAVEALPKIAMLRKRASDLSTRAMAAVTCAGLRGNEDDWNEVRRYAEGDDGDARSEIAWHLRSVRDPKSVSVLVGMVEDAHRLHWDSTGKVRVGDYAEESLAWLTGKTFHRSRSKWQRWWKSREGRLPDAPQPNPGLIEIERLREGKAARRHGVGES